MDGDSELRALAAKLRAAERRGAGTAGRPYPVALRRRVVDATQAHRAAGGSLKEASELVGVSAVTLWSWAKANGCGVLRQVQLTSREPASDAGADASAAPPRQPEGIGDEGRIQVTGPGGLRIEGLSIASLADLVRRLS